MSNFMFAMNPLKFEDIRNQIILYLNDKNEFGGQFDFSNSNISYFVDIMAYTTMLMSYNVSHVANNVFLDTTEIRKNAVSIAKQLGYKPKRPNSAKIQGKLIYKGVNFNSSNKLTIPSRSPFIGSFGNIYYNTKPIILSYKGNPTQLEGEYLLTEGTFHKYKVDGTGESNYTFTINNKNIDENNFSLYVVPKNIAESPTFDTDDLVNYLQYKWSASIPFITSTQSLVTNSDTIYFMEEDIVKEGFLKIAFGNDIIGKKPSNTEVIVCEYLETKGIAANNENLSSLPPSDKIGVNTYKYYNISELGEENSNIFSSANFDISYQNIYNKSFGGTDIETIESIKFNAPKFYSFVGRCVSRNDYLYYLNSLSEVKSCNVIGGDELFPNDDTKLGNIYISLVPNINDTEFLYGNNIYILNEMENAIKYNMDDISIISTRRHFYKPSYILIDVAPILEFNSSISVSEKNKIYQQVKNILIEYFATTYNKLGVKFRESKMSAVIDTLDTIVSSYFDLSYSFIINNTTVDNLIEDVNNFLFIPVKDVKDSLGNITGTTNFVKTNQQVVREDLLPEIDWAVLDKTVRTNIEEVDFIEKIKLMNTTLLHMNPSDASIYGDLIVPVLNRQLYSRDYVDQNIMKIWFIDGELLSTTYDYVDRFGKNITVSLVKDANIYYIEFAILEESNTTYRVGRLVYTTNPYTMLVVLDSPTHQDNLLEKFHIDESNYVFNGVPYNVNEINATTFEIKMRMVTTISDIAINGTNQIFNVYSIDTGTPTELLEDTLKKDLWLLEHVAGDTYGNIKYNATVIGYLERSHTQLLAANKKFKSYIDSEITYNVVFNNLSSYTEGDYFIIIADFFIEDDNGVNKIYTYFNKDDVYFVDSNTDLVKASIKKLVSCYNENDLITIHSQGDLFENDITVGGSDYLMFDTTSESIDYPNYTIVTNKDINKKLDASILLPKNLENNLVLRILIPDEVYSVGGYFVYYAGGSEHKLQKPLYIRVDGSTWSEVLDKRFYDGDVIVYSETNATHINGGWYVLENVIPADLNPSANARLNVRADEIISLDNLSSLKSFNKVLIIDTTAITITSEQLSWFTNPPTDSVLNQGDLLICIDYSVTYPNGLWTIFDDDYYNFQFDILNNGAAFPEPLMFGDVFDVTVSNNTITNFAGITQLVSYEIGDKILYYDVDSWKKYDTTLITKLYSDTLAEAPASIGDMVLVTDIGGNFNNTTLIDAPKFNTNFLFNYNDVLYYTGTHWIKKNPINVYNDMLFDGGNYVHRKVLNDIGYNSDFRVVQSKNNTFDIYLDDIYNNTVIGNVDYFSGKMNLNVEIDGYYNKIEKLTEVELRKLTAIFKLENYNTPIQMDKIKMKPITKYSTSTETDFDTTFNQYIIGNVLDAVTL